MRTIPVAMTWELFRRGWRSILLTIPIAIGLPVLILTALRREGMVDVHNKSMVLMQVFMLQVLIFSIGAALFGAQGKMSRLYAYPVRTTELVAWKLLPMMAVIAVETTLCIGLLDVVFD